MPPNFLLHSASLKGFPALEALEQRRRAEEAKKEKLTFNLEATLLKIRDTLHGGQIEYFDDVETKEIGIAAGYGSGKTLAICAKAVQLASLNQGFVGCVLEPTGPMLRDIWIRKFDDFLDLHRIPYTFRSTPLPEHILHLPDSDTVIVARAFENYKRIVGPDWAWAIGDEVDTVQENIASKAYNKIIGRIRVGNVRQLSFLSTPEGFSWHYKTFGSEKARNDPKKKLIRMRTQDNPHLPPDYLDDLRTHYTGPMLKAYMDGIYVNLTTGQVYDRFNRNHHVKDLPGGPKDEEIIIAGIDFNVRNMSAVLSVQRGISFHVFKEITDAHDTDDLCKKIRSFYKDREIHAYPDATGANTSTNSSQSDIGILESYGFTNKAPRANPRVRDRVNTVQAMLENGKGETRLWIAPECVKLIECLERQSYDEKGEPDKKSGYDHLNDALGYPVHEIYAWQLGLGGGGPMTFSTVQWGYGAA